MVHVVSIAPTNSSNVCVSNVFIGLPSILVLILSSDRVCSKDIYLMVQFVWKVYPEVVLQIAPSPLWAFLFFVMLLTLGIDSQFCGVESLMTGLVDNWPEMLRPHRKKFTLGMICLMFILGLPMITRVRIGLQCTIDSTNKLEMERVMTWLGKWLESSF